jgi:hypothetical protein
MSGGSGRFTFLRSEPRHSGRVDRTSPASHWGSASLAWVLVLVAAGPALGVWGARPAGLGNAFVGVADDINAIYWNPAGLAWLQHPELGSSHYLGDKNETDVDHCVALCLPFSRFALAGSYAYDSMDDLPVWIGEDPYQGDVTGEMAAKAHQWRVAGAVVVSEKAQVALGASVDRTTFEMSLRDNFGGSAVDEESGYDASVGALWRCGREVGSHRFFSAGLLIQNVLEEEVVLKHLGLAATRTRQVCAGAAFRPSDETLIALQVDDLASSFYEDPQLNAGFEFRLKFPAPSGGSPSQMLASVLLFFSDRQQIGLRNINNGDMIALTGGIGYDRLKLFSVDIGYQIGFGPEAPSAVMVSFGSAFKTAAPSTEGSEQQLGTSN